MKIGFERMNPKGTNDMLSYSLLVQSVLQRPSSTYLKAFTTKSKNLKAKKEQARDKLNQAQPKLGL